MSLQSKLFRGDSKLEAAAVSNSAHILPGAIGAHVAKIQRALVILDGADLSVDGRYGPVTATAVLHYKQKRDIVNRNYQSQADNIVGVMTMAALDREMASQIDPTVVIGRVMFALSIPTPTSIKSLAPLANPVASSTISTTDIRSIVRGNPYLPNGVVPPIDMPASLPPTKTYAVQVSIEPSLTGDDFIELSIINSSPSTGTATVFPTRIKKSTTVVVTGASQTQPGNAGKLQIQATLNGKDIKATSDGFSVCAHPLNYKATFFQDINTDTAVGMIVADSFESDSGKFNDLDKVQLSEVVEIFARNDPPFKQGSGHINNSGYLPAIPPPGKFAADTHAEPRPAAGPAGVAEKIQLHIFKCLRCGAVDKAVPNSGFDITHEVFVAGKQWKHKVTKKGENIGITLPGTKVSIKTKAGSANIKSPEHNLP